MNANPTSERLRQLRSSRNLSQQAVSEALHMGRTVLQRYESGEQRPGMDKLIALADFFDVSLDYLVGRSDDPRRH